MKIVVLTALAWWVCSIASARSEVVRYWASGLDPAASIEEADIEKVVGRLRALDEQDIFQELTSQSGSLRMAKKLAHMGLKVDGANLAAVIREKAIQRIGLGEIYPRFSIEGIVVFDKALARNRGVPEKLGSALQYRQGGDVLLVKDSPVRWILVRDSNAAKDVSQQLWAEGLWDHECLAVDELQRKKASELYAFFLEIVGGHLVPNGPGSKLDEKEVAAGKIAIAWSAVVLTCGQFHADRAYLEWIKSHPDEPIPAMLLAAGGAETLTRRFAEWARNPSERLRIIGAFTLRK